METMVAGMQQQGQKMAESVFRERMPDATTEDIEYMRSLMKDILAETINIDEMLNDIIPVYQKHLTESEIDATIAFYSTPAGRSLLDKMPAMMQDAMQVSGARSEERIKRMLDMVDKRTKEYLEKRKKPAEAPKPKP